MEVYPKAEPTLLLAGGVRPLASAGADGEVTVPGLSAIPRAVPGSAAVRSLG